MNSNPGNIRRRRVIYRRKGTSAAASYFKAGRAVKFTNLPRITQTQSTGGSRSSRTTVRTNNSIRTVQTAAIPRPWSRKEFGQNDPTANYCTYQSFSYGTGTPALSTIDSRTLVATDVTEMVGRTTTAAVNLRRTNCIHLIGIRIFLDVFNQVDQIINFEYAVVSPKGGKTIDATNFLTAEGLLTRGQTVDAKSALDLKSSKVNNDLNFVFSHKRQQLLHQPPSTGGHTDYTTNIKYGASARQMYEYIPINRKITWDKMTDTVSDSPVYLAIWCYGMKELAAAAKITGAVQYQHKAVLLYKNVEAS